MAREVKFSIEGMTCTGCSSAVEKRLRERFDCEVDFDTKTALVSSKDNSEVDVNVVYEMVDKLGYKASIVD